MTPLIIVGAGAAVALVAQGAIMYWAFKESRRLDEEGWDDS